MRKRYRQFAKLAVLNLLCIPSGGRGWRSARTALPLPVCAAMTAAERLQAGRFGVSVHGAEEAKAAIKFGAAYLTAGHIYASSCKQGVPPRGPAFLREICTLSPVPVYAIGGIGLNKAQLEEVLACGAAGACVRSAFMRL